MKERLKHLRKSLNMTQAEFAESIGVKCSTVSNYEAGTRVPINPIVAVICNRYNVREQWLRTGEGEMHNPSISSDLDALLAVHGAVPGSRMLVHQYLELSPDSQENVLTWLRDFVESLQDAEEAIVREKTIDEKVAEYRRQLELEQEAADGSSRSSKSAGA